MPQRGKLEDITVSKLLNVLLDLVLMLVMIFIETGGQSVL